MCDKSTGPIWKKCPDDRADCIKPWEADLQDNEWNGWGTQLKPAHEPICMARKPIKTSIVKNVQKYGTGALNIDATRIEWDDDRSGKPFNKGYIQGVNGVGGSTSTKDNTAIIHTWADGRFPSNVIGEIAEPYQKYFYCPKVSRKERHIGYEMPPAMFGNVKGAYSDDGKRMAVELDKRVGNVGNNHPTVKPVELMKYLIKLVTPAGGTVLDPFNGSGSTGMAAVELGYTYIGCELDPNYVEISKRRIEAWVNQA